MNKTSLHLEALVLVRLGVSGLAFISLLTPGFAQIGSPTGTNVQTAPPPTTPAIISRGPDVRTWKYTQYELAPGTGEVRAHDYIYQELASGLTFQAPDGTWQDSQAEILPTPEGSSAAAASTNGTLKVSNGSQTVANGSVPSIVVLTGAGGSGFLGPWLENCGFSIRAPSTM